MESKFKIKLDDFCAVRNFVNKTSTFQSDINLIRDNIIIDGKSVLSLFDMDLSKPLFAEIISDDENEISRFVAMISHYKVD